jgi:predicted GIY-YIG superfamily endonuclease
MEYSKDIPWVRQAVMLVQEEEQEEDDEDENENMLYRWSIVGFVKKVTYRTVIEGKGVKWQLSVNMNMNVDNNNEKKISKCLPNFRPLIELRPSTAEIAGRKGVMGMFAAIRFERGDIILVQKEDESCLFQTLMPTSTSRKPLLFGGGWAIDAESIEGKMNNAIANDEGVVRAIQRILPRQEIFVDYKKRTRHPVEYLDALVRMDKGEKGKVTKFVADREGKVLYLLNSITGKKEATVDEKELVQKLMKSKKRKRLSDKRSDWKDDALWFSLCNMK